jgi:hypothetical protein
MTVQARRYTSAAMLVVASFVSGVLVDFPITPK